MLRKHNAEVGCFNSNKCSLAEKTSLAHRRRSRNIFAQCTRLLICSQCVSISTVIRNQTYKNAKALTPVDCYRLVWTYNDHRRLVGKSKLSNLPYTLRRAECDTFPARLLAIHEYSPPSSTMTWLILTWLITSPWIVTYWPMRNLKKKITIF